MCRRWCPCCVAHFSLQNDLHPMCMEFVCVIVIHLSAASYGVCADWSFVPCAERIVVTARDRRESLRWVHGCTFRCVCAVAFGGLTHCLLGMLTI